PVLKTGVVKATVGSNPTPSAINQMTRQILQSSISTRSTQYLCGIRTRGFEGGVPPSWGDRSLAKTRGG
ncbi:MAG: hypothetical protein ABI618_12920, partial [Nitrospirota bacterium]